MTITVNEMCWNGLSSSTDQYDYLVINVALPQGMLAGAGAEDLNGDPSMYDKCYAGGNGVMAKDDNFTPYAPQLNRYFTYDGNHNRLESCIYPTIFINYVACVTHLSAKNNPPGDHYWANIQAGPSDAQVPFAWEAGHNGHPLLLGGDFNLDPLANIGGNLYTWYFGLVGGLVPAVEADLYPSTWWRTYAVPSPSGGSTTKKVDYIWAAHFTRTGGSTRGWVNAFPSNPYAGYPVSDHYFITGQY